MKAIVFLLFGVVLYVVLFDRKRLEIAQSVPLFTMQANPNKVDVPNILSKPIKSAADILANPVDVVRDSSAFLRSKIIDQSVQTFPIELGAPFRMADILPKEKKIEKTIREEKAKQAHESHIVRMEQKLERLNNIEQIEQIEQNDFGISFEPKLE